MSRSILRILCISVVISSLCITKTYSQTDWRELELCPKKLISEMQATLSFGSCNFGGRRFEIQVGSELTLSKETKEVSGIRGSARSFECRCEYKLEPEQYKLFNTCTDQEIIDEKEATGLPGEIFRIFWLDKFDDVTFEECTLFSEKYGESGSSRERTRIDWTSSARASEKNDVYFVETSSSHKISFGILRDKYFFDNITPSTNSSSRYIGLNTLQSSINPIINLLHQERAIDNSCPQPDNKVVNHDFLLLKNRWPTPGDYIDSIIYGQFSDTLPPGPFQHEICLSKDFQPDDNDVTLLTKSFIPTDFKKLDTDKHEAIDEDTYLSYKLAQLYVDDPVACDQQDCPDKINLANIENGVYNVLFKSDSDSSIIECDETNNIFPGLRIEIDDFNPGECDVCPATVTDLQGNIWRLSNDLPDCDDCDLVFPPTAGRAYYDGQSYIATCVYDRDGEESEVLAWIRWHENVLGADSILICNEEGIEKVHYRFCPVFEYVAEGRKEAHKAGDKALIFGKSIGTFDEQMARDIVEELMECYKDRAIDIDSLCMPPPGQAGVLPSALAFNPSKPDEDTIIVTAINGGSIRIDNVTTDGELNLKIEIDQALPVRLTDKDSLLIFVNLESPKTIDKKQSANVVITGDLGSPDVIVPITISKPVIEVHAFFSDVSDPPLLGRYYDDTLYTGQSVDLVLFLSDSLTGKIIREHDPIEIEAFTVAGQTTSGLKSLNETFTIQNGESSGFQYDAFENHFDEKDELDDHSLLSGKVTFLFRPINNPDFPVQDFSLVYHHPFDFIPSIIGFQQGVPAQNIEVQRGGRTYPPIPYIADHNGHLLVAVEVINRPYLNFKRFETKNIGAVVTILRDGMTVYESDMDDFNLEVEPSGFFLDRYLLNVTQSITSFRMDDIFDAPVTHDVLKNPGKYQFKVRLEYKNHNTLIHPTDRLNDECKTREYDFVNTEELNLMIYEARLKGISEYPNYDVNDVFNFLRNVYPVGHNKVKFMEGGQFEFEMAETQRETEFNVVNDFRKKLKEYHDVSTNKRVDAAVVLGDGRFIKHVLKGAGVSNTAYNVAIFEAIDSKTSAHEIGHILGLGDTYVREGFHFHKKINPPTKIVEDGNIIDEYTVHLINENRTQPFTEFNYDVERSLYDFMGTTIPSPLESGRSRHTWVERVAFSHLYFNFFKLGAKNRSNGDYISLGGTINEQNEVNLDPISLLKNPPYVSEEDALGAYQIVFRDSEQRVALDYRFDFNFFVYDEGPVDEIGFQFYLPYDENYASVEFMFQDSLIHSFEFSSNSPEIELFTGKYDTDVDSYSFQWSAIDQDGDDLNYSLFYKTIDGDSWPIEVDLHTSNFVWNNLDQPWFDKENGKFVLEVTDGFNEVSEQIEVLQVTTSILDGYYANFSPSASPLPFHDKILLTLESQKSMNLIVSLLDVHGQKHKKYNVQVKSGINRIELQADDISSGVFFLHLTDIASNTSNIIKVLKSIR